MDFFDISINFIFGGSHARIILSSKLLMRFGCILIIESILVCILFSEFVLSIFIIFKL